MPNSRCKFVFLYDVSLVENSHDFYVFRNFAPLRSEIPKLIVLASQRRAVLQDLKHHRCGGTRRLVENDLCGALVNHP